MKSELEEAFAFQAKACGLPVPARQVRFHQTRRWTFDFAWPLVKVAAEIEGGIWIQGRHSRGSGFIKDIEKYNEATRLGWDVYRFTDKMVKDGSAVFWMERILLR